jgi:DNA-binding transcriptional MocR family regulator
VDRSDLVTIDAPKLAELLGDWVTGSGPLYRKLAAAVRSAIEEGTLPAGAVLPAERRLAELLSVSRATVVAAYDLLRGEALLESRQGSGTRIAADVPVRSAVDDGRVRGGAATTIFQRLVDGPGTVISLTRAAGTGVPAVGTALREVLDADLDALLATDGYHAVGLPALREAIAEHFTVTGLPTAPDQVLVTTGAHQALGLVSELYLRRGGSSVLIETPSFPGCTDVFRSHGAHVLSATLDEEGIDADEVAAALARHRPTLLYVMPTYQNPTGTLMSGERRQRITALAARHQVPIVEDSAYDAFRSTPEPPPLAAFAPPGADVLTLGSLGKTVWSGLRTGWVRGPATIIERLARRKVLADLGSAVLDQAVAARLLPRMEELRAARDVELRAKLGLLEDLLHARLPSWRWRRPDGGLSLWVEVPGVDTAAYAQVALRHGVEIVPGQAMDGTGRFRSFFRLPFAFPEPVIEDIVLRLAGAYADLTRNGPVETAPVRVIV